MHVECCKYFIEPMLIASYTRKTTSYLIKKVMDISFQRRKQAITLAATVAVIDSEKVQVDPQVPFSETVPLSYKFYKG